MDKSQAKSLLQFDDALKVFSKSLDVYKQGIASSAVAIVDDLWRDETGADRKVQASSGVDTTSSEAVVELRGPFLTRKFSSISNAFGYLAWQCNRIAKEKGWWDKPRGASAFIALVHSELSEALEAARDGNDELFLEELADVFIRIFDWIGEQELSEEFVTALIDKINFNATRPYRHGKKF